MHTPFYTINQALTSRLDTHIAAPLIFLPCVLRHVFSTTLFRGIRSILLAVRGLQVFIQYMELHVTSAFGNTVV
jgi:hypothetical protein